MATLTTVTPLYQNTTTTIGGSVAPASVQVNITAPSAVTTVVTKLQFRKLFLTTERIVLDNIHSNGSLSPAQIATVVTLQKDLDSASEVQLGSVDVSLGIQYLVSIGVLSQFRAARILANLPPL